MMRVFRQSSAALFLSLMLTAPALGGDVTPAKSAQLGLSSEGLGQITAHFEKVVEASARAGIVAMVARQGKIAYSLATGLSDMEAGKAMTLDTRFRIASMTKPVTSLAILMLVEEGKLGLDDVVSRYLPEFSDMRVATSLDHAADGSIASHPATRQITIRQLLTHTAGLGYVLDFRTDLGRDFRNANLHFGPRSLAEMTRQLASHPLYFEPGARWQYSFATDVLGRLVEVAAGQSFDSFVEERIFAPLGMDHTNFLIDQSFSAGREENLAVVYRFGKDGDMLPVTRNEVTLAGTGTDAQGAAKKSTPPVAASEILHWPSGGAGLISTAGDYMRFLIMLANGGELDGRRLVSAATMKQMTANHVSADAIKGSFLGDPEAIGFGFGFYVIIDAGRRETVSSNGEYGWGGYFGTSFFVAPEKDGLIALMMTQRLETRDDPAINLEAEFKSLVYGAIADR